VFTTHCTNPDCAEVNVAKDVPEDLAAAAIVCGTCGEPTTPPADTGVTAGDRVA